MSDKHNKPGSPKEQPKSSPNSGERSVPKDPKTENLHIKPDINKSNNLPTFQSPSKPPKTKE